MIFTVGHTKTYRQYLDEYGTHAMKAGRDPRTGEEGGTVWETYREASRHCPDGYSVFGVLADWEKDTAPRPPGECGRELLRKGRLVILNREDNEPSAVPPRK